LAHILLIPAEGEPETIPLVERFSTVGRTPGNTIRISDGAASRKHCMIKAVNQTWTLVDLGSANGTVVNGERVRKETDLSHDDRIQIGKTVLVFKER
jgi:pSer/pThr/pTyr-binding forkhead associated (FHA) protein